MILMKENNNRNNNIKDGNEIKIRKENDMKAIR